MVGSLFYSLSFISPHVSFFYLKFCGHLSSWRNVVRKKCSLGINNSGFLLTAVTLEEQENIWGGNVLNWNEA